MADNMVVEFAEEGVLEITNAQNQIVRVCRSGATAKLSKNSATPMQLVDEHFRLLASISVDDLLVGLTEPDSLRYRPQFLYWLLPPDFDAFVDVLKEVGGQEC